jgi:hypothetical protein
MEYNLEFIKKSDLIDHVEETINKYEGNLQIWDLSLFNKNIIDPIKMLFDKVVNAYSWEELIENEIFRQRDKSNTNAIGYFHQNIFKYIDNCEVPELVWDVIWEPDNGIEVAGKRYKRAKVEMKNKHNTMNSSSAAATYAKMMSELIDDPECVTFLVEAIAKRSQDIPWVAEFEGKRVENERLRRVSLDRFYAMVTGEKDAFYQLCLILPEIITFVFENSNEINLQEDTVFQELMDMVGGDKETESLGMALMMLGFGTYYGFTDFEKKDGC